MNVKINVYNFRGKHASTVFPSQRGLTLKKRNASLRTSRPLLERFHMGNHKSCLPLTKRGKMELYPYTLINWSNNLVLNFQKFLSFLLIISTLTCIAKSKRRRLFMKTDRKDKAKPQHLETF